MSTARSRHPFVLLVAFVVGAAAAVGTAYAGILQEHAIWLAIVGFTGTVVSNELLTTWRDHRRHLQPPSVDSSDGGGQPLGSEHGLTMRRRFEGWLRAYEKDVGDPVIRWLLTTIMLGLTADWFGIFGPNYSYPLLNRRTWIIAAVIVTAHLSLRPFVRWIGERYVEEYAVAAIVALGLPINLGILRLSEVYGPRLGLTNSIDWFWPALWAMLLVTILIWISEIARGSPLWPLTHTLAAAALTGYVTVSTNADDWHAYATQEYTHVWIRIALSLGLAVLIGLILLLVYFKPAPRGEWPKTSGRRDPAFVFIAAFVASATLLGALTWIIRLAKLPLEPSPTVPVILGCAAVMAIASQMRHLLLRTSGDANALESDATLATIPIPIPLTAGPYPRANSLMPMGAPIPATTKGTPAVPAFAGPIHALQQGPTADLTWLVELVVASARHDRLARVGVAGVLASMRQSWVYGDLTLLVTALEQLAAGGINPDVRFALNERWQIDLITTIIARIRVI